MPEVVQIKIPELAYKLHHQFQFPSLFQVCITTEIKYKQQFVFTFELEIKISISECC